MRWLSLNPAEVILAGHPYVYFMIYFNFIKGSIKNICRNLGFALALSMNAFPASVTLFFVMLSVKYEDKSEGRSKELKLEYE